MMSSNTSEIHISGRIDNFLFGAMKDPYFQEFQNSNQVFKDTSKTKQHFLESFFSLFLENDPFENKTNLEIFNENIDVNKLQKLCPHFYKIYQTVLPESLESKEIVNKDGETYLKTENIRSTEYDHYSFLEEILDSPSHLSKNTNPQIDNQFRVFSNDLFIEIFSDGNKIDEGQLGEVLALKEAELDDDFNFKFSKKQKEAHDSFNQKKLSFWDVDPSSVTKQNSIRSDGFWPLDYFKFVLGDSPELFDKKNNFFSVANNHFKFDRLREVKVIFSNMSKCTFTLDEKIDFEKLSFLRCGLDENCRFASINYDDNINMFNFLAYNGELIKPNETIFSDKGIQISLTENNDTKQPAFYELFIS